MQILSPGVALAVVLPAAMATNTPCEPKFAVYDAVANAFLTDIVDGSVIDLSSFHVNPSDISIEYVHCGAEPESVSFYVNGDKEICEDYSPFTIAANDGEDYFEWSAFQLGEIEIKAIEYSAKGCMWSDRSKITKVDLTLVNDSGSGVCTDEEIYHVASYEQYDILVLPERFGEAGVTWSVAFSSQVTSFNFTLPYADDSDLAIQQELVGAVETMALDLSSLTAAKLIIPEGLISNACTNVGSVSVTIPRTVKGLCIGDVCRKVICSLGPEFISRNLADVSFVPSNTELFFGSTLNCTIAAPADWDDYVVNVLGGDPAIVPPDFWFYSDQDRDGASGIVEYYGLPIGSFFSDVVVGAAGPFAMDPLDPDTDSDLFLDGYEILYGQDPTSANTVSEDTDGDTLTNFEEQIRRTNPFMADTDGDGVDDATEISQGTNPFDDTDYFGQTDERRHLIRSLQDDPCEFQTVEITLSVGDPSGSHSERYTMTVGKVEHQATTFGVVRTAAHAFTPGTYQVTVKHRDSNLATPDFDYFASISWTASPEWDITLTDPQGLLGSHFESSYDATLGKFASLSIVKTDGVCDYSTCVDCRGDSNCFWDLSKKACKKDCRRGRRTPQSASMCPCEKCKAWAEEEREDLDWIDSLPRCPCSVSFSGANDESFAPGDWEEDSHCNPTKDCSENHPGAIGCIRQFVALTGGNQCCYRADGSYIASGRGAGTPDKQRGSGVLGLFGLFHLVSDYFPYDNCCLDCEIQSVCDEYIGVGTGEGDNVRGARADNRGCE